MASFVNSVAYSTNARNNECCDNCLFNVAAQAGSWLPDFERHRFDVRASIRYPQSAECKETQVNEAL